MHYVAFSRVTKYEGLYIADINETQICVSKNIYLLQTHKNKSLKTLINISSQNENKHII